MSIKLTIDGKEVTADENQMLVDVALDNGVYIPTLCYQRGKPCLAPAGFVPAKSMAAMWRPAPCRFQKAWWWK